MTRVLVTGGTGFLGRPAADALRSRGVDVVTIGRADGDLLDRGAPFDQVAHAGATHLLHLAWCARDDYLTSVENLAWAEATLRLVDTFASSGGRRVVLASSAAVYGPGAACCSETTTPLAPTTPYAAAKLAAATAVAGNAAALGIDVVEARVFQPYGPGEDRRRLVPSVVCSLLAGEPARCSAGTQQRDFVHVDDVAEALAALVLSGVTGPVNVGTGTAATVAEVATTLGRLCGRPDLVRLGEVPMHAGEAAALVADPRRLTEEVGWRPRHTLESGLADTIAWWRDRCGA